ncbi:MAG: zinc-dependent metalloprotease [bacterium]
MKRVFVSLLVILCFGALLFADNADAASYWQKKAAEQKQKEDGKKKDTPKGKEEPFDKVIKDFVKIEGLFDFYVDSTENKVYMAIKPDQFDKIYLANITRSAGDGTYFDAGAQAGSFPFKLRRIGKNVQFLVENLNFRADGNEPMAAALDRSISESVYGNTKIESKPNDDGAILIDPTGVLITDIPNASYFLGQEGKTGFRFDDKNSYFEEIKSFPENTEIEVKLHYATSKPSESITMGSPYSMFLSYHYSLSTIPETDYRPRLADDRVGFFLTQYQDYSDLTMESPYVRFINRWNLQKQDPNAAVSEPVEPIVYWVENSVPEDIRAAVAEGIEWWQPAFEAAGFKNAIIAKQMPDTADWDPADVRFNVIRWVVRPGNAYAVGPSRANPYTGEIYDADVRIMADFIRSMYNYAERFIEPLAAGLTPESEAWPTEALSLMNPWDPWEPTCTYAQESALQAAEAMAILEARTGLVDKPELTKKFVHQYIVELVAHEVGHTLGLRHNFKASTIYSREQLADPNWTSTHGVHGSIMEYAPANVAPEGMQQADFFLVRPGAYDMWAIEYGYTPIVATDFWDEQDELASIASRCESDPKLVYMTDEDCFGNSPRAIDPYVHIWDLTNDPFTYWSDRIDMSRELWSKVERLFEKPGENYKRLRNVFGYGWGGFSSGGAHIARFIGGIENSRQYVGGALPFTPIPAETQRTAMQFLKDRIWAPNTFQFDASLVNKLQPERMPDFNYSVYRMERIDYPLHDRILAIQTQPLRQIYNPTTLHRLSDITMHYAPGEDVYTMTDVFQDVRRAIWTPEITGPQNITSTRRNLQRAHLDILIDLVTDTKLKVPEDARTLARVDLRTLKGAISSALGSNNLDTITRGHFEESLARIDAAMQADILYKL